MKRTPSILLQARQARDRRALARRSSRLEPGQTYGFSMISPVLSGVVVTPQTALTLTSYYAGVNVISGDVAKLPFLTYRRSKQGGKEPLPKHRNYRLLSVQPNPEMNAVRFWQALMGHVLGWGGGLAEIVRKGGEAVELWPLNPATVKPHRTPGTKELYYQDEATGVKWRPENILHVAGLGFDGISGYSPATMARQAIGLGIGAEQFGATLFGNGAIPKGILKHPKRLSETAARNLRESFERVHGGSQNANRTAILEEGADWVNTQINPDDAQFLATRQFQVLEIARILNLPPHKLGDYSQAHLANVEESNRDYLESCLQYWLEVVAAECNAKLFFEDEQGKVFCQHDTSALLKGNTQARGEFYKTLKGLGAINADTIASMEGLPLPGPENGGDKYLVQMQDVPAEQAGENLAKPKPGTEPDADDAPAKPRKPGRQSRYNPHHDHATGKFTSGKGGGGGKGTAASERRGPEEHLKEVTARAADRRRAGRAPVSEGHAAQIAENKGERKDRADEVRGERKDQGKLHSREAREMEKEHAAERKQLLRDHADEVKELKESHKQEKVDLAEGHVQAHEDLAIDHKQALLDLDEEHAQARADLHSGHKDDRHDARTEHLDAIDELRRDHRAAIAERMAEHLEALRDGRAKKKGE